MAAFTNENTLDAQEDIADADEFVNYVMAPPSNRSHRRQPSTSKDSRESLRRESDHRISPPLQHREDQGGTSYYHHDSSNLRRRSRRRGKAAYQVVKIMDNNYQQNNSPQNDTIMRPMRQIQISERVQLAALQKRRHQNFETQPDISEKEEETPPP